jgi:hypothetical protein
MHQARPGTRADVARLLRVALHEPASAAELAPGEMDLLLQLLRGARLHGRFAAGLARAGILEQLPPVARHQLESILALAESRARLAQWELNRIAWATRDRPDMDLVLMKGCAYMLLGLPIAAGRVFADVDLLVAEEQLAEVEGILNRRGWKTKELSPHDDNYYRRWSHELPPIVHREREVEIDVHHNVVPRTARLNPPAAEFVRNSRALPDSRYRVLADEDLVLNAAVHLMFDSDLAFRLRDLVEIDGLCRIFASRNPGFWEELVSRADALGLGRPLYYSCRYACELLDTPVPEEARNRIEQWAPPAPVRRLMDGLVPLALLPEHPLHPTRRARLARLLLYMRSHWLRMPPWLLAYHLSYKFFAMRFRARKAAAEDAPPER